jgi:predicted DNA-binding transcriptional regulator AlpA
MVPNRRGVLGADDTIGGFVMTERMVLWPELHAVVGLSRTTIWRMERAGQFPRRVLLSARIHRQM